MPKSKQLPRNKILFILAWVALWAIPWGKLPPVEGHVFFVFLTDLIRLGIGLAMFIFPGVVLFRVITFGKDRDQREGLIGALAIGFALSVAMIAILGLIGRICGFSFQTVKMLFAALGLAWIGIYYYLNPAPDFGEGSLREFARKDLKNPALVAALIIVVLMSLHEALLFVDDTTYLAYLTNWQYSTKLGFNTIIYEADVLEIERFWLMLYPMGQALLSDISGVPGVLLMSNYLEPYLVTLAVLTAYWFGQKLGLAKRVAGLAVLIQISLYTWMIGDHFPIGMWFYQNMAEDKVTTAFLLAPVFFVFVLDFIDSPTKINLSLIFLIGLGITLTHPVLLFLTCAVAAGMLVLAKLANKIGWLNLIVVFLVFLVIALPFAIIRLADYSGMATGPYTGEQASKTYEVSRYTNVISERFYGLNPGVMMFFDVQAESSIYNFFQYIRVIPFVLLGLSGVLVMLRFKATRFFWYFTSTWLLVLIATVPYTGWILGYFASARMISRAAWFAPLGLGCIVIIQAILEWKKGRSRPKTGKRFSLGMGLSKTTWGIILCFMFISPILLYKFIPRIPAYFEVLERNRQLAHIGAYIDRETEDSAVVIALEYWDLQLVPAISADARLISFREEIVYNGHNNYMPLEEAEARIEASDKMRELEKAIDPGERCSLMEAYGLEYIIGRVDEIKRFLGEVAPCQLPIKQAYRSEDFELLQIVE